jgi:hypothetical protein
VLLLTFDIPQTALVATLDTYDLYILMTTKTNAGDVPLFDLDESVKNH